MKPNFSKKFLEKINKIHASASNIYQSINPEALQLIPIKTSPIQPPKMKR